MPVLPQPRQGKRLEVKRRPVPFSFWPSRTGRRRHALQSILFAVDPWIVIEKCISKECPNDRQKEAVACLEQARDFYVAATQAGIVAARPLATYYSFMNLVKAFCLTFGNRQNFDRAQHGLSAQRRPAGTELEAAFLDAYPTPNNRGEPNNFAEFYEALTGQVFAQTSYDVLALLPQILPGHRLWAAAAKKSERFISLHDIHFVNNHPQREMWLCFYVVADDLSRLGVTHQRFLQESDLANSFREVDCNDTHEGRRLLRFEQTTTHQYQDYPADELLNLVSHVRQKLWLTVATVPPYRRYYVYLAPAAERPIVVPQLLSIYAITYYLGSITRYRPHHFDAIVDSKFGPRIQEFVTGQSLQFLYLMASALAKQDVTRPSIL